MPTPAHFDKYEAMGAYHWLESDPASRFYNPPLEARYQVVLKRVKTRAARHKRVLDVGCGDGYLLGRLSSMFGQAAGVETDIRGVELARRKLAGCPNCDLTRATAYQIPFRSNSFDLVTCTDVIEHLEEPAAAVSEIGRVLKPAGELILTTPQWRPDRKWDERHVHEYRGEELVALLQKTFPRVELSFFWPRVWSRIHNTRVGWRLMPYIARWFFNPFLGEGDDPLRFGQLLAVCRSSDQLQ